MAQWQTQFEEVEIDEVEVDDFLIWPPREKELEVVGRRVRSEVIGGVYVDIRIDCHSSKSLWLSGSQGGMYLLRPKERGEGYVLESENGDYVEGPDTLYRV